MSENNLVSLEKVLNSNITSLDVFESEFRRIYSELYPNEASLIRVMDYYRREHINFPIVDPDPRQRIEFLKWMLKEKDLEDYKNEPLYHASNFLFSDIKEIVSDTPIDIVYLSPSVVSGVPRSIFYIETLKVNLGKCLCGLKNNNLTPGNFSRAYWQKGMDYFDACEDGLTEWQEEPFAITLDQPTYKRPILVISNILEEGVMLGRYHNYLHERGIGAFCSYSKRKPPKIPGFNFISKNFNTKDAIGYILDSLSFF